MKNPTLSQEIQMWFTNVYDCPVDEKRFEDITKDLEKTRTELARLLGIINRQLQQ